MDRGRLRMERQRQLELEQLQWEQEALVMPEDLNRALLLSFESVKTEFSDLDGLSWPRYPVPLVTNPWAVEEPTPKRPSAESDERTPVHSPTFASQQSPRRPRPDIPPQDTVRVSRRPQSPNQFFPASHKDPPRGSASSYSLSHPPPNIALACHGLRH